MRFLLYGLLLSPLAVAAIWIINLAAGSPWAVLVGAAVVAVVLALDHAAAERRRPVRMHRSTP